MAAELSRLPRFFSAASARIDRCALKGRSLFQSGVRAIGEVGSFPCLESFGCPGPTPTCFRRRTWSSNGSFLRLWRVQPLWTVGYEPWQASAAGQPAGSASVLPASAVPFLPSPSRSPPSWQTGANEGRGKVRRPQVRGLKRSLMAELPPEDRMVAAARDTAVARALAAIHREPAQA